MRFVDTLRFIHFVTMPKKASLPIHRFARQPFFAPDYAIMAWRMLENACYEPVSVPKNT
jgi:hypothetical protein